MKRCRVCNRDFATGGALMMHYKDAHPEVAPENRGAKTALTGGISKRKAVFAIIAVALVIGVGYWLYGNSAAKANQSPSSGSIQLSVGSKTPNANFTMADGRVASLSQYEGKPVLLWFVSTWCDSCAAGNQALDQNMGFFNSKNVTVLEVETYNNLGYSGPSMSAFVSTYAPAAYKNSSITIGYSTYNMMSIYDGAGYPDIYYLIAKNGAIVDISSSPGATMAQLKNAVDNL